MKQLMMLALILGSLSMNAQNHREMARNLSAEQLATLQTKKLTLALALDDAQAKKVYDIQFKEAQKRKEKRKVQEKGEGRSELTKEEKFARQTEMLDAKIGMQAAMKKALTAEQFTEWRRIIKRKSGRKKHEKGKRRRQ